MKPGRFIFIVVILLSYSLNSTAAPVNTGNAQPIPTYDEAWMNSYLPPGVTMKKIRDWQAGMTGKIKRRYQDSLESDINLFSKGREMTAQELLVLRIQCQGNQFMTFRWTNPEFDEADLKKIFRTGLSEEENMENAGLFKSLDDGDDPAEDEWKNSLLPPCITIWDIHSWEASMHKTSEKSHYDALRRTLVHRTEGKEFKPKDFKALLIQLKKERYTSSRPYKNLRLAESTSEDEFLPPYVTKAMLKTWEDTMAEKDKEIYSKTLNAERKRQQTVSETLGTNQLNARELKFRGEQYVMAQEKKRHANPLTPPQKAEIITWIENLKLKEFPAEADVPRSNELLSSGVTMEMIRKWEASEAPMLRNKYMTLLKREVIAWMVADFTLPEIQNRSLQYRGQRYLQSQNGNSSKRKRGGKRIAKETGAQSPKRTATGATPIHGELLNTSNASPRIASASSAPFDNANSSRGNSATPPTKQTQHTTEETPIHHEPPNTPNASPSIAHSPLPETLPTHLMIDADKHALPPHPGFPHGTINLGALERNS
ncbi:hypothetical protein H0H93_006241 [Arthromyces matolae]|nr:hypothetical protein H0H93_006241 [Arthromyces matolae]